MRSTSLAVSTALLAGASSGSLAACQRAEEPSVGTAASVTTESTSTTEVSTSTSVSTGPVYGREIRLGLVSPVTGPLALYGKADDWWIDLAGKTLPDGILAGDGEWHLIRIVRADSGSHAAGASQAAARLISDARVDLMMVSGPAAAVEPVTGRCEAVGCPLIANLTFLQDFLAGRAAGSNATSRWTYAHAYSSDSVVANYGAMWDEVDTNKKVGLVVPENGDGSIWLSDQLGTVAVLEEAGYSLLVLTYPSPAVDPADQVDPAPTVVPPDPALTADPVDPAPTADPAGLVSSLSQEGCEICWHAGTTQEFDPFWRQAVQQEYRPKVLTTWRALNFPQELEALRSMVGGVTMGAVWHPTWPFRDSLTGLSCRELADDYLAKTGEQWTPAIGQYGKFEWAVDVFQRVTDLEDKTEITRKIAQTDLRTCAGPVDFTEPVGLEGGRHVSRGVILAPLGGAQWVRGETFPFEQTMVGDVLSPELPVGGRAQTMQYEA